MSLCAPVPAMRATSLYKVEVLQASGLYKVEVLQASGLYKVEVLQATGLYKVEVLQASGLYNNFPIIICIFQGNPLPLPSACFSKPHPLVIRTENNN